MLTLKEITDVKGRLRRIMVNSTVQDVTVDPLDNVPLRAVGAHDEISESPSVEEDKSISGVID